VVRALLGEVSIEIIDNNRFVSQGLGRRPVSARSRVPTDAES
jgi:hypothetical protein